MEGETNGLGKPVISFVIPTLQEESVLEGTLQALRTLSSVPYEIIVSDGGSTDRTQEIARRYADHVVTHDRKTRQNIAMGRNAGAAQARGELMVFMDADVQFRDIDRLFTEAVQLFRANPDLTGLSGVSHVFPGMEMFADRVIFGLCNALFIFRNNVLHSGGVSGEFQMVRSETFRIIGGYDERLFAAEDLDLFGRLSKRGRTRVERSFRFLHTGRRAHKMGWPQLLLQWGRDFVYYSLLHRSYSTEWKVIR